MVAGEQRFGAVAHIDLIVQYIFVGDPVGIHRILGGASHQKLADGRRIIELIADLRPAGGMGQRLPGPGVERRIGIHGKDRLVILLRMDAGHNTVIRPLRRLLRRADGQLRQHAQQVAIRDLVRIPAAMQLGDLHILRRIRRSRHAVNAQFADSGGLVLAAGDPEAHIPPRDRRRQRDQLRQSGRRGICRRIVKGKHPAAALEQVVRLIADVNFVVQYIFIGDAVRMHRIVGGASHQQLLDAGLGDELIPHAPPAGGVADDGAGQRVHDRLVFGTDTHFVDGSCVNAVDHAVHALLRGGNRAGDDSRRRQLVLRRYQGGVLRRQLGHGWLGQLRHIRLCHSRGRHFCINADLRQVDAVADVTRLRQLKAHIPSGDPLRQLQRHALVAHRLDVAPVVAVIRKIAPGRLYRSGGEQLLLRIRYIDHAH